MEFYKGIIFDFNGTLFFDSNMHLEAWREFSAKLRGTPFSDDEMREHMFGRTNKDIIEYGVTYNYKFREQSIELNVNVNGKKSKGSYQYSEFKKIEEYDDRYILRLKDGDLVYVLKSGFENERMIQFFVKNVSLNKLKIVAKKNPKN